MQQGTVAAGTVDLSLNEVEMTATKAARGGGLPWGLADEAGKAARWLAAQGLPWAEPLLDLLASGAAAATLRTGCGLMDEPVTGASGARTVAATPQPLLLLPFLARAAKFHQASLAAAWSGGSAGFTPTGWSGISGVLPDGEFSLSVVGTLAGAQKTAPGDRASADARSWAALEALAAKTYVPATTTSRERGAGAGLSDND